MTQTDPNAQGFFPQGYEYGKDAKSQGVFQAPSNKGVPEPGPHATNPYAKFSSDSALLWGLEQSGANAEVLRVVEQNAADKILSDPDPTQALNLRKWASIIPNMPGVLLSLSTAGITPDSELGQWLVRSAAPAFAEKSQWKDPDINSLSALMSDPDKLAHLQNLPLAAQQHVFTHGPETLGRISEDQLKHLEDTGHLPGQGLMGYVGDVTRPVFAGLQAGYEGLMGELRLGTAQSLQNVSDIAHGEAPSAVGPAATIKPHDYKVGNATFTVGGNVKDVPSQITAVQALEGKSLGKGLFPSGEASEAAVQAQKAALVIDGHALTPGRALASLITTPGTMPYQLMSGTIDFASALELDPAAFALGQVGRTVKASRFLSTPTDEAIAATADHLIDRLGPDNVGALKSWAMPDIAERYTGAIARGAVANDLRGAIIEKLSKDPGSLQQLVERGVTTPKEVLSAIAGKEVGLMDSLARRVDPQNALTYLNSPTGVKTVKRMAGMTGTDIYMKSGKSIPPELAWQLGEATSEAAVRSVYAGAIGKQVTAQPYLWSHPFQDLRYLSRMPNYAVDSQQPQMMVERAMQELQIGKVPKAEWDQYLRPLALSTNRGQAVDGYKKLGNRIADELLDQTPHFREREQALAREAKALEETGIETPEYRQLLGQVNEQRKLARKMTTYFQDHAEEDRKWWIDSMGNSPYVPGLSLDGEPMKIEGPYAVSELLNRAIPVLGGDGIEGLREIKRTLSTWAPVWRAPIIGKGLRDGGIALDFMTRAWKVGVLARLALPIRSVGEEQVRMATAGLDSMFHNPMSYIAYVMNKKGSLDLTGQDFLNQLTDHQSQVTRAIGNTGKFTDQLISGDRLYARGWGTVSRAHPNYVTAWADRLSHAHIDPVGQSVARAIVDPDNTGGLDAVKEAFFSGKLSKAREELIDANLGWGSANLVDRSHADAYIDGWVQRLHDLTAGGHDELMQAIASGEPWRGVESAGTTEFRKVLTQLNNEERSPEKMVGPIQFEGPQVGLMKRATNAMFSVLIGVPAVKLTNSPAFKQFYFQRWNELLPHMDDVVRAQVVERAAKQGIRLTNTARVAGERLSLEQADLLAKDFGLQSVHKLLYYPEVRSSAIDTLRNIAPFANAWKDIFRAWTKLVADQPQVIRRAQQGVTEARESGWWFTDPADGVEKFTIMPAAVMQHISGVPFPMVGRVAGLNIVGQGLPGVGPVVQWPAGPFLAQFNKDSPLGKLHDMISPMGDPDFSGGALEELFPGWIDKFKTSGWFATVPGLNIVMGQSADQKRILDNVAKQAFEYQMSTGKYDMHDPEVLHKVWIDSVGKAQHLFLLRGLAQFASPSAPSFIATARLKDGALVEQWVLATDYRKMLTAAGDSQKATLQFVAKYGPERIFATQPFTRQTIFGLPTTAEAEEWKSQHGGFASTFPNVFPYWAPQGGAFDRSAYLRQIEDGTRQALKGEDWLRVAEARLGNAVYDNLRQKLPATPSDAQRQWLRDWKTKLSDEYPGFDQDRFAIPRDKLDQNIRELGKAVRDPVVKDTPLAHAATVYLDLRERAIAQAKNRGYSSLSGDHVADLRDWLFDWGTNIATKMPEFTTIWNEMLQSEVDPNA